MSGKRKKSANQKDGGSALTKSLDHLSLSELIALEKSVPSLLQNKLYKMSTGDNIEDIMKANLYMDSMNNRQNDQMKALIFDPNAFSDSGRGYKVPRGVLGFDTLRRMGDIFIVRSVVNTRVEQVQNFLHFSVDEQKEGFTIRKKRSRFEDKSTELSTDDKKKIEYIVDFLEKGGYNEKWDSFDTFQDFGRKIVFDSLTLDQLSFEIVRNRGWELSKYRAIDASLVRLLDSTDPKLAAEFEKYRYRGYLPRYCQVWNGMIAQNPVTEEHIVFYPWELGYGVRNKSTSVYRNGYGVSELETLVNVITWILYGFEYNGNFFSKGSQPKGFINVKNQNISPTTLQEFRQAWTQTMVGVSNSHRTPIMQGIDLEWIDLQKNNRDMEFNEWIRFLIIMLCSVYRIDPSELGFNFKETNQVFGQDGQKQRLEHSREKGLKPLLIFLQNIFNHYLISEMFDGEFELAFTGIEVEDEQKQVELDKKKLDGGMVSMEDIFKKYSGREFNEETDTILNPVYQNVALRREQAAMFGSSVPGEDNPDDTEGSYEKSIQSDSILDNNPIWSAAQKYMEENLFKN